ncbi:MAG: hypothetical protein ABI548_10325 [Polyangiaceae bacterium]
MNKNKKLLFGVSSMTVLAALFALQGCDDGSTSGGAAGAPAAPAPVAGASGMAAAAGGSSGMASTIAGGGSTAAGTGGTATTAGAGGASAGAGGSSAGAGGSSAGAGGSSAGAGGSMAGAGGSSAGAGGSAGGDGRDCTTFCSDEMTTCTFTGANKAYASASDCMTACTGFVLGAIASLPGGPTATNTYACRRWHLNKAATYDATTDAANRMMHCGHTAATSSVCN